MALSGNRTTRRGFLRGLAAGAGTLALGGLGVPGASAAGWRSAQVRRQATRLAVWGWQSFTPEGDRALGDQMKAWGGQNGAEVEYTVIENLQFPQKLAAAVEAKAPPDITMLTTAASVQDYAGRGLFADVADVWNDVSGQAGGFYPFVNDRYRIGNSYYGIPFEADTSPLFARLDLIEKVTGRREPPKTLDELTEVGKKINNPPTLYALGITLGRCPDCASDAMNLIWNDGGTLVDADGKVALNSQATVAALNRLKSWWDDKLIPPSSTTWDDTGNNAAYQSGQVAFVHNPPSIYGWMVQNDKELLADSTMAAFPAGTSGSYSFAGAWSWSVFDASRNQSAAKDLIRYLMDPRRLQQVYAQVGGRWFPIYRDGKNDEFWTSKPQFQFYPDLLNGGRDWSYPAAPEPRLMAAIGEALTRNVIPDMVQDIIVKGSPVDEAVRRAHDALVEIWRARGANV